MANTDYYAALASQSARPVSVEKVLYRLTAGAENTVLLGYQAGEKLYKDAALTVEETGSPVIKGKRIVDEIPFSLTAAGAQTPAVKLDYAVSASSFHTVSGHPGNGSTFTYQLEVANTPTLPTNADYALHDSDAGRQTFEDNKSSAEQISLSIISSYRWLRFRRTDQSTDATATTVLTGRVTVCREVA